ncbi:serine/threonine protein phosphatase 2A 57 kDa regulatory subunit B' beta isoform-like [Vigna umbellata]|uniref:serine/threonine protein phosphatase 2A 57 kDa regulatory subunit B' beta isoform-like n=1 Tax=Vigna umbellata TaxID=87088 RepID=UPI001F5FF031|nr:serine/threonine protein phosphatase 2A 57 kDa regulatory subunit B' beta isoform-like [Vigna umbellata]
MAEMATLHSNGTWELGPLPPGKQIVGSCWVAERALYMWNNEQFVKMALIGTVEVFNVIVEGMEKNLKWHWSKSVRQLTESVKVMLEEMDPDLYSKGLMDMEAKESMAHLEDIKRKKKWERIEWEAAKNQFFNPQRYIRVSY